MLALKEIKDSRMKKLLEYYANNKYIPTYLRYHTIVNSKGHSKDVQMRFIEPIEAAVALQKRLDEYLPSRLGGRAMHRMDYIDAIDYLKSRL